MAVNKRKRASGHPRKIPTVPLSEPRRPTLREAVERTKDLLLQGGGIKRREDADWFTPDELCQLDDHHAAPEKVRRKVSELVLARTGHAATYLEWFKNGFRPREMFEAPGKECRLDAPRSSFPPRFWEVFKKPNKPVAQYSLRWHLCCLGLVYKALAEPDAHSVTVRAVELDCIEEAVFPHEVNARRKAGRYKRIAETSSLGAHHGGFFSADDVTCTNNTLCWFPGDCRGRISLDEDLRKIIARALERMEDPVPSPGSVEDNVGMLVELDEREVQAQVLRCAEALNRGTICKKRFVVISVFAQKGSQIDNFVEDSCRFIDTLANAGGLASYLPGCLGVCIRVLLSSNLRTNDLQRIEACIAGYLKQADGAAPLLPALVSLRSYGGDVPKFRGATVMVAENVEIDSKGLVQCGEVGYVRLYLGPCDRMALGNHDVYVWLSRPPQESVVPFVAFRSCAEVASDAFEEYWRSSTPLQEFGDPSAFRSEPR